MPLDTATSMPVDIDSIVEYSSNMDAPVTDGLKAAIEGCGLSLRQLAQRSGVNIAQLSRFMRGERDLRAGAIDRLCVELGLSLTSRKRRRSKRT